MSPRESKTSKSFHIENKWVDLVDRSIYKQVEILKTELLDRDKTIIELRTELDELKAKEQHKRNLNDRT
jgi:hypothetical protein